MVVSAQEAAGANRNRVLGIMQPNPNLVSQLAEGQGLSMSDAACPQPHMTSFIIDAHLDRKVSEKWKKDEDCVFCIIIDRKLPASIVYEDEKVIAILGR